MSTIDNLTADDFSDIIASFTAYDYQRSNKPFGIIEPLRYASPALHKQLLDILLDDAVLKGIVYEHALNTYAQFLQRQEQIEDIMSTIQKAITDESTIDKATVLPFRCGTGKSTVISYMIRDTLIRHDGCGLLIMTDSKERMAGYLSPANDDGLSVYLKQHAAEIVTITEENFREAQQAQRHAPVLIMSTQRYFSLSPEKVNEYLVWDGGTRPLIIIDERPPLQEVVNIHISDVNQIATALIDKIPPDHFADKQWCIDQWENTRRHLYRVVEDFEQQSKDKKAAWIFYQNQSHCVTEDDERFWSIIQQYEYILKQDRHGDTWRKLKAINRILTDGAILQHQKRNSGIAYSNTFSTLIDHRTMITDVNAKVIILDGTGDIHPIYHADYIHRYKQLVAEWDDRHNQIDLTLAFINAPITKDKIVKDHDNALKLALIQEIHHIYDAWKKRSIAFTNDTADTTTSADSSYTANYEGDFSTIPVFTYKDDSLEDYLKQTFDEKYVKHFGPIRGLNTYRDKNLIFQIGLNRANSLYYLTFAVFTDPDMLQRLKNMSDMESGAEIEALLRNKDKIDDVMYPMLLDDLEQNLFRGVIRSHSFCGNYGYYVFCNTSANRKLISMARDRYALFGKTFSFPTPSGIELLAHMNRNTKQPTAIQRFISWYRGLPEHSQFTNQDMLDQLGLTPEQLKALRKNKIVHEILAKCHIGSRKSGMYQKTE